MQPIYTITSDVNVGIYDNCQYIARIYADKIITVSPYVKWIGNSGGYAERTEVIRDKATVDTVLLDMADQCEDSAWATIGRRLDDTYLTMFDLGNTA